MRLLVTIFVNNNTLKIIQQLSIIISHIRIKKCPISFLKKNKAGLTFLHLVIEIFRKRKTKPRKKDHETRTKQEDPRTYKRSL
jgi:hypothetical protein